MKALKIIKKIIIGILTVTFFIFVIAMTILLLNYNDYGVTQFDNTSLILIDKKISLDTPDKYKKGDLVLVEGKRFQDINVGDEIFAYQVNSKGNVSIYFGAVGELHSEQVAVSFENGPTLAMDYIIGSGTKTYNKIGNYLSIIESKWGFLFIVLVPSFLIFIYQVYALIVEIKYGKDEILE